MNKVTSIGIMTGTSCDAADFCALKIDHSLKSDVEEVVGKASFAFPVKLRKSLLEAQKGDISAKALGAVTLEYSMWLADCAHLFIKSKKINPKNTIISAHGQTIWHSPPRTGKNVGFTIQILDPSHIEQSTGCTVLCGFRQADMAAGGQGAPLVPYYHWLRANSLNFRKELPFVIHNIGGISNMTLITKSPEKMIAFDSGPGNCLIDLSTQKFTNNRKTFDGYGKLAAQYLNSIEIHKIKKLASSAYFLRQPPKSTGRELFNEEFLKFFKSSGGKLIAEVTFFTAITMANAYAKFIFPKCMPKTIFLAGGGANNPVLCSLFTDEIKKYSKNIKVDILPDSYMDPQFLEAAAFARFGYEALLQHPISIQEVTGAKKPATGALIFPGQNFKALTRSLFKS